jgi:hypothetical protein
MKDMTRLEQMKEMLEYLLEDDSDLEEMDDELKRNMEEYLSTYNKYLTYKDEKDNTSKKNGR